MQQGRLRRQLEASVKADEELQKLLDEVVARRLDPASAATRLLDDLRAVHTAPSRRSTAISPLS